MIVVTINKKRITIQGHSGYAESGKDIVCSAVSVLLQTLIYSLKEFTEDEIGYEISPGSSKVEFENLSEKGNLLVDSFFLGICAVADAYPDYVRIE